MCVWVFVDWISFHSYFYVIVHRIHAFSICPTLFFVFRFLSLSLCCHSFLSSPHQVLHSFTHFHHNSLSLNGDLSSFIYFQTLQSPLSLFVLVRYQMKLQSFSMALQKPISCSLERFAVHRHYFLQLIRHTTMYFVLLPFLFISPTLYVYEIWMPENWAFVRVKNRVIRFAHDSVYNHTNRVWINSLDSYTFHI